MSVLTPVTNSTMVIDSGSTKQAGVDLQPADRDPGAQVLGVGPDRGVDGEQAEVDADGHHERRPDEDGGHHAGQRVAQPAAERAAGRRTRPGAAR